MKNEMIWSYFINLSNHMWDDENTPPRALYEAPIYQENNNVDIPLWDDVVKFLKEKKFNMVVVDVGDGVRFETHPEISAPDAWDKDFLKAKLDEMRAAGLEPIPKLNFSCGHNTWMKEYRKMVSSSIYYTVCADLIGEVCELFGTPRFFHLGLDEEKPSNAMLKYREAVRVRNAALWWHDAYFFFSEVEKHGVRPWIWSDYFWDNPDLFAQKMPKSVLQSNWFYNAFRKKEDYPANSNHLTMMGAYEKLEALGYDQVPCCSLCSGLISNCHNLYETMAYCKEKIAPERLKGFMVAPWAFTDEAMRYYLFDNAHRFYRARERVYPDTLR